MLTLCGLIYKIYRMKGNLLLLMKKGMGIVAALFLLLPVSGYAIVYTVNSTTDGTALNELRGALMDADSHGGTHTINLSAGTYVLTGGSILFGSEAINITINGAGAASTIISGNGLDRIFIINSTGAIPSVVVSISGITFENGFPGGDQFGGGAFLCGGPSNSTTVTNCVFSNNKVQPGVGNSNGGAINQSGGGNLNISNCTFSGNSVPDGDGGAITFFESSVLSITGCSFTGNSVASAEMGLVPVGGAIWISANSSTGSMSITGNTFLNNTASTSGYGGAIQILNESSVTALINYNRFYKNTAGQFPDVAMGTGGSSSVDVTNNWWGLNFSTSPASGADPHAGIYGGGSASLLIATPYLELTCSGSSSTLCDGSGDNSTVMTASFAKNSAGTTISTANLSTLIGLPITFSTTQGTLTGAQTSIQSNGTATVTFTDNGVTGTDNIQPVVDSVSSTDAVADGAITVNAPASLAATGASGTETAGSRPITDGSCNQICLAVPSGASPLSGSVTGKVTIDATMQSANGISYLQRHYDITPAANASTATATITLYFLQTEFDTYNASVSNPSLKLPTGATDMTGRGNLTITQFHGTGTVPGGYTGWTGTGPASVLITPGASNVVWNSAMSWWEVSFSVTGFSGFFVTGPIGVPLPVVLEGFGGVASGSGVLLSWKVGEETGLSYYEIQRSVDGDVFDSVGVAAVGGRQFFDGSALAGKNFYRLKMVNVDGSFTYSQVVVVSVDGASGGHWVYLLENPVHGAATVMAATSGLVSMRLTDASGKVLWVRQQVLGLGANTIGMGEVASGVYFLTVVGTQGEQTIKVLKQ